MLLKRHFRRSSFLFAALLLSLGVMLTIGAHAAFASGTTRYVNPSGNCGGAAPCYSSINTAIGSAVSGDTILMQASINEGLYLDRGLANITITAANPAISLTVVVLNAVNNWNFHDFTVIQSVVIQSIPNGVTITNLHVSAIALRQSSGPINGNINISGNTLPGIFSGNVNSEITIAGATGQPVNGVINIRNNVGLGVVNIFAYPTPTGTGNLNAAITVDSNALVAGTNIGVYFNGNNSGVGNIAGNIVISNNTTTMPDAKLGVVMGSSNIDGLNVIGAISGNVTYTGNRAAQIVVWSGASQAAPMTGNLIVTNNDLERIELTLGGVFSGNTLTYSGNFIHYQGSSEGTFVSVFPSAIAANTTVNITNNTGNSGFIVRTLLGNIDGALNITGNFASHLILQEHVTNTKPYAIIGNTLVANNPQTNQVDGNLTITSDVASLGGGSINYNNVLALNLSTSTAGGLAGDMTVTGNAFGLIAGFYVQGPTGAGTVTMTANTVSTRALFQNIKSEVHFNRFLGYLDAFGSTPVNAQENWWGCNAGPGTACQPHVGGGNLQPHLVLSSTTACTTGHLLTGNFNILSDSSGAIPAGNVTPGLVNTSSVPGTPLNPSVPLINGAGTAGIGIEPGTATNVTYTLDRQSVSNWVYCGAVVKKTIGIYRGGMFFLRNANSSGAPDFTIPYGPTSGGYGVAGDWTGIGIDTIGVYDRNSGNFFLRDSNTPGPADHVITLGITGDQPIVGRWSIYDTHDGVGVFRPSNGLIYLRNTLTTGYADEVMVLGIPGDVGLAGDWSNKGFDSPGVYRPSQSNFYLTDRVCDCVVYADRNFIYGPAYQSPLVGDWSGSGALGVGIFSSGSFFLRNSLSSGYADAAFTFGLPGDIPLAGHWSNAGSSLGDVVVAAPPAAISKPPTALTPVPSTLVPHSFDG